MLSPLRFRASNGALMQVWQSAFYAAVTALLLKQWMVLPKGARAHCSTDVGRAVVCHAML